MHEQCPPVTTNLARVKVVGIPGLSLVAIAFAIAFQFPLAGWLLMLSIGGGFAVGGTLIALRRRPA